MQNFPIVTPKEMKKLEELAFADGESEESYMEAAGKGIAEAATKFLVTPQSAGIVYLLVGKGNNGGDAYVAGTLLLREGFSVTAYCLCNVEECSPLSQIMGRRFAKAGGDTKLITSTPSFEDGTLIIDGLTGTGFTGSAKGVMAEMIEAANNAPMPVFSIDIPSGLNGETGEVASVAIFADTTLCLGLPKIGFFLEKGWNHVGDLVYIDFGLPEKYVGKGEPVARLVTIWNAREMLPNVSRIRHKYEAGYVLAVAGSSEMSGAAILSSYAALRSGAGIVRLFHPEDARGEFEHAPYELIRESWDLKDTSAIERELSRAKALLLGPGMGRDKRAMDAVESILRLVKVPMVLDADGLYALAERPEMPLLDDTVITPHRGEMERILKGPPTFEACQEYVKKRKVTVVLKGAPTLIFHRFGRPLIVDHGDPGMATAGTGDVLTGMIAAFLAQGLDVRSSAALGVFLHGLSGELAASELTSYCLVASDLIEHLPDAIQILLSD